MLLNIDGVPAEFVKNFLMLLLGLAGGAGAMWTVFGRKRQTIEPQPLRVKKEAEFTTVEACGQRHAEVDRRLDHHDGEIMEIWKTLRKENTAIRQEMARTFQDVERSLGRIEGKIDDLKREDK